MDETRKKAVWMYKSVRDTHEQTFIGMERMKADIAKAQNLEQLCDVVALLKKSEALVKDLRAEMNKTLKVLQKVGCMMIMRDGRIGESIYTEWVNVHPDTKTIPPIPRKSENPEAYRAFCEYFGVPEHLIDSGAFKPHWPSICDYVTSQESKQQELPPGITPESCTTEYTLVCRWNKDVEPDQVVEDVLIDDPWSYPQTTRT